MKSVYASATPSPSATDGAHPSARIREESFGRRVREHVLPSPEILSQRLFAQSLELAEMRRHLQAYHALVATTIDRLGALPAGADAAAGSSRKRRMRKGNIDPTQVANMMLPRVLKATTHPSST